LVRAFGWVWPVEVVAAAAHRHVLGVVRRGRRRLERHSSVGSGRRARVTTIVLVFVTRAALKERYYSAVMAATGLLYLAILTAFGTDLVARAMLAG
jgi:hypothetical protein